MELKLIKEFIGRGVWRCLYDPSSSLLVAAGFDSAIKLLTLPTCKSEYVRSMHFTSEDGLYVTTNKGFLYVAKICDTRDVAWTELCGVREVIPIVCMSVFPGNTPEHSPCVENWIALGDVKGRLTVVRLVDIRMLMFLKETMEHGKLNQIGAQL